MKVHGLNKEMLFKACENFHYYLDILRDVDGVQLTQEEENNLVDLLATYGNNCMITKREELAKYDITLLRKLVSEISAVKDENVYRDLLCNYLFNKGFDQCGNVGLLESDTIKELVDIIDENLLFDFEVDGNKVFSEEEVNLFKTIKLMFEVIDSDLWLSCLDDFISNKVERNIIATIDFFNKLKK